MGGWLIVVGAVIVYWPSLRGDFILDDDLLVTNNRLIVLSGGLRDIWFSSKPIDYWPLTNSLFWIEWRLFGAHPAGYHLVNLGLHIASALLVWRIVQQLAIPGAWLAALLFAIHPVNVESVAWISQSKNTLSMLFFLLSVLWYLKSEDSPSGGAEGPDRLAGPTRWYWLSLGAFTLAMLSKGSVAVMPLLMLVILWWQRGRVTRADLAELAPFFAVAIVLSAVNIWFQSHGSSEAIRTASLTQRLLGAGAVVWFYLSKALLPLNLSFVYPQWNIDPGELRWWLPLVAAIVVTALLFWQRNSRFGRPLLAAWLFFCIALVPVMGFTDVGYMKFTLVADRYQHIAILAVLTLLAAAWATWLNRLRGDARLLALLPAAGVLLVLGFLALIQSRLYADPVGLYEETLAKNPDSWLVHHNLGGALDNRNQPQQAAAHYQRALQLNPQLAEAENNLGVALFNLGRTQDAIEHLQKAIQIRPEYPDAHNNLGNALFHTGKKPEAMAEYRRALELKPEYPDAHNNLGNALIESGRATEARKHFREAVQLDPTFAAAHQTLAGILGQMGRYPEAVEHYRQTIALEPNNAEAHHFLGNALAHMGRIPEAISEYEQALRLKPNFAEAHFWMAWAQRRAGRLDAAIAHYQQALRLKPNYPDAENNLASALRQAGRIDEAIMHYERAIKLKPDFHQAHLFLGGTLQQMGKVPQAIEQYQAAIKLQPDYQQAWVALAGARAQLGRFADATAAAERALALAQASGNQALAAQIEARLNEYRAAQAAPSSGGRSPAPAAPPEDTP